MDAPARITIIRKSAKDFGDRQVVVSLDGEPLATLMFGESATKDIAPGPHRLRAHNTLVWKTLPFEVKPGEHLRVRAVNRPPAGTWGLLALLGVAPLFLTFERMADDEAA